MKTYYLYDHEANYYFRTNNQREAIKNAKYFALKLKKSIIINKNNIFFGIAEFPYHLRNCILDTHDIKFNKSTPF